MKKIFTLNLLMLIVSIFSSVSAQYYVSGSSGSDLNPGSLALPFKTIQKAADVMIAGETCYIMSGVYRETVTPLNNGTMGGHIVFTNYQNDKVIITGTDSVSGWLPFKNGIYKTYAPDTVFQLCVNKKMANEARWPNSRNNNLSKNSWNPVTTYKNGNAVYTNMNFPSGYWVGGYAVVLVKEKWTSEDGKIDASNGNTVHCTQRSNGWWWGDSLYYTGSGLGYITHHLNALDTINEWLWQHDTLYYYPENPSGIYTMTAEARTRIYGFNCSGKEYIEINNIHFVWSTVNLETATGCILNESSVWFPTPYYYFANGWDRQALDATNNYGISNWKGKGVAMSGYNNNIKNCYIAHSWGDGISVGGQNNTVENCLVEDCDWIATDDAVITTVGVGHTITHNTLRTAGRCVLVNRLSDKTDITYNDMYDCGKLNQDLGLTDSYHTNAGNSQIAYNWIHDNHATRNAAGIYLDEADTAYIVHHNVIWNLEYAIQTNKPAVDHQIYNNTVWACTFSSALFAWGPSGTYIENQVVKNNLSNKLWDNVNYGTIFSNNLVSANPLFTNAAAFDFTLTATSPAIDYGMVIPGITDGYSGAAPDAGAYEYGVTPWIPGSTVIAPDISEVYDSTYIFTGISYNVPDGTDDELTIYPNPTDATVHIDYKNIENIRIEVYDVLGYKIMERFNCNTIDLSSKPDGHYIFVVTDLKKNILFPQKIILKK